MVRITNLEISAVCAVIIYFLTAPQTVCGHPKYRKALPNASSREICAMLGHSKCIPGGGTVNKFGSDFRAAGYKYTKAFCELDSDGDGVSNGAEMGDPCCKYSSGSGHSPARSDDLSNPGDKSSIPKKWRNRVCLLCFVWKGTRYCY